MSLGRNKLVWRLIWAEIELSPILQFKGLAKWAGPKLIILYLFVELRQNFDPLGFFGNGAGSFEAAKREGNYGAFIPDQAAENRSHAVTPVILPSHLRPPSLCKWIISSLFDSVYFSFP